MTGKLAIFCLIAAFIILRDALRVEPFGLRARLIGEGAETWRQLCLQAGIADVELGTVRDALRGL